MAFKQNQAGFQKLAHSARVGAACKAEAEKIAALARSTAPVDSGDYANSIHVVIEDHPTRITAQVVASDWKSLIIESITGNLARAVSGKGGLVKYTSKSGKTSYVTQKQAANYTRNRK